jgi:uncharacterized protein YdeI (YjbR/CyaY-like superfamily)
MSKPKSVDDYLAKLEGNFAHPILKKARAVILDVSPKIEECIKWGAPSLEYKGVMITLAAFKTQAAVWFHKGALLKDEKKLLQASSDKTKAMRKYMLKSIEDFDEAAFRDLVIQAIEKNERGEQVKDFNKASGEFEYSERLSKALKENPIAKKHFEALPPYKKKEYAEHIETAKQEATKQRRLEKAVMLLEKGLGLHDKYRS